MITFLILGLVLSFLLSYTFYPHWWTRERYERLSHFDLPSSHQSRSKFLLLHYGNIDLERSAEADTVRAYATKQHMDYYNLQVARPWLATWTFMNKYPYDYIMVVPTRVQILNTSLSFKTLLRQAGEACMILARDDTQPKRVNLDVVIFRACEWSEYKLHQFHYKEEEQPDNPISLEVILDQVYTTHVHKTFGEFKEYLDIGVPYILTNICVYNEHTLLSDQSIFMRYIDREPDPTRPDPTTRTSMYPWDSIKHPRFASISSDNIDEISPEIKDGSKIPKIIFQTMETTLVTVNLRSCIEQVRSVNPGYKYYYFTSYDCRTFIQKYYPDVLEAYDVLLPGAYKADLWRYCVLHKYGGFYMDCRMYPYASFNSVITKEAEFMSCIDGTPNMLYQAILGALPQSSYMKNAIDECLDNIKRRQNRIGDLAITGPRAMGRALNKSLGFPLGQGFLKLDDKRIVLLRWNSTKIPKYIMNQNEIFACHKYTKLLSEREIQDETSLWLLLTGKEHYSVSYRNNRIYKDILFK
jgi:hypothetical protein